MHHPTDRITHTTAFVTPVAEWVHYEGSIRRTIAPWANALTTELHFASYKIWRKHLNSLMLYGIFFHSILLFFLFPYYLYTNARAQKALWVHPMKDRSDDLSHHERTLLPRSYISLRNAIMPRLTSAQSNNVIGRLRVLGNPQTVARHFGVSRQTVSALWPRYNTTQRVNGRPRSGRHRLTAAAAQHRYIYSSNNQSVTHPGITLNSSSDSS